VDVIDIVPALAVKLIPPPLTPFNSAVENDSEGEVERVDLIIMFPA
jgi:hypothetical protein